MPDSPPIADGGGGPMVDARVDPSDLSDAHDDTWRWAARTDCYDDETTGQYLDVTLPLEEQTGGASDSGVIVFKKCAEEIVTRGGFWFRGFMELSAGEDLLLDGPEMDLTAIPPRVYEVGEEVGPGDRWVSPGPGLQTEHIQDPSQETAPTEVWFTAGIIGVRFTADDGLHYGFVEVGWDDSASQGEYDNWHARYLPVRWDYNPVADQPLTIPP